MLCVCNSSNNDGILLHLLWTSNVTPKKWAFNHSAFTHRANGQTKGNPSSYELAYNSLSKCTSFCNSGLFFYIVVCLKALCSDWATYAHMYTQSNKILQSTFLYYWPFELWVSTRNKPFLYSVVPVDWRALCITTTTIDSDFVSKATRRWEQYKNPESLWSSSLICVSFNSPWIKFAISYVDDAQWINVFF